MLKVYTSGSFLDENEVPSDDKGGTVRFLPEWSGASSSSPARSSSSRRTSMPCRREGRRSRLGLESANDDVLDRSVRKGFHLKDYQRAAEVSRIRLRPVAYIPIAQTTLPDRGPGHPGHGRLDRGGTEDLGIRYPSTRSMCNPTPWSRPCGAAATTAPLGCGPWSRFCAAPRARADQGYCRTPSGGGTPRGVHNCGKCDRKILDAVERFSYTQDVRELDGLECGCRHEWEGLLLYQDRMRTAVDLDRHLGSDQER